MRVVNAKAPKGATKRHDSKRQPIATDFPIAKLPTCHHWSSVIAPSVILPLVIAPLVIVPLVIASSVIAPLVIAPLVIGHSVIGHFSG
jgi:hypothetical protein